MPITFDQFKKLESTNKVTLAVIEASKRLQGWVVHSGSVYKLENFEHSVITEIADSGTALTVATSIAGVTAGKYYLDRDAETLYLRTSDSANPNGKFISCVFKNFFSDSGAKLPYDLSTGFSVLWEPLISNTSFFGQQIDNQNQLGVALEGSGSIEFINDLSYWRDKFDKWFWENKNVAVYIWSNQLAVSSAKLIYKGKVKSKAFSTKKVQFQLKDLINELRAQFELSNIEDYSGALVLDSNQGTKQRLVYGRVFGMVPSPIDQVNEGYPLAGTVSLSSMGTTITGSGTAFLTYFTPGDSIRIVGVDDDLEIATVTSNTSLTLTEAYDGITISGATARIIFAENNRNMVNREFLVAGHALKEPTTTVTGVLSNLKIIVADASDFEIGDSILLNSAYYTIGNISGTTIITVTTAIDSPPANGDTVTGVSIKNVYIDDQLLLAGRDYTLDAATAVLTLATSAEANVAPITPIFGSLVFANGSRNVSGTSSEFLAEVQPGDWIGSDASPGYFQVLSIESNTSLTLRTASTFSATSGGYIRRPRNYTQGESTLTCDALGKTENGVKTGAFIKTAPGIVEDILKIAGLTAQINTSDFTTQKTIIKENVGLVIPSEVSNKKTPKYREIINKINQSVFGTLKQDASFLFTYEALEPDRTVSLTVDEADILSWKVQSKSDRLVKSVQVGYESREFSPFIKEKTQLVVTQSTDVGQYLVKTEEIFEVDSILNNQAEAETLAQRYAFFKEASTSTITFLTKMRAIDNEVNDKVKFSHPQIFERIGSNGQTKISAIQSIDKKSNEVELEIEDLGNIFSRSSAITANSALDFDDAGDFERVLNGYITDNFGMIDNDALTSGIHLIS